MTLTRQPESPSTPDGFIQRQRSTATADSGNNLLEVSR